jgi:hypothetical protein
MLAGTSLLSAARFCAVMMMGSSTVVSIASCAMATTGRLALARSAANRMAIFMINPRTQFDADYRFGRKMGRGAWLMRFGKKLTILVQF